MEKQEKLENCLKIYKKNIYHNLIHYFKFEMSKNKYYLIFFKCLEKQCK